MKLSSILIILKNSYVMIAAVVSCEINKRGRIFKQNLYFEKQK